MGRSPQWAEPLKEPVPGQREAIQKRCPIDRTPFLWAARDSHSATSSPSRSTPRLLLRKKVLRGHPLLGPIRPDLHVLRCVREPPHGSESVDPPIPEVEKDRVLLPCLL